MGSLFGHAPSAPAVPPPPPAANPPVQANSQSQSVAASARARSATAAGAGFDNTLLSGIGDRGAGAPANTAMKDLTGQ